MFLEQNTTSRWIRESPTEHASSRGLEYLRRVEQLTLEPGMVDIFDNLRDQQVVCQWIGEHIPRVNSRLNQCLQACHDCIHPQKRRLMQIFAIPLAQSLQLDGVCNIETQPVTILIDVGRVPYSDWVAVVAHEYAHAHLGKPGHDAYFAQVLTHLCLGLNLQPPVWEIGMESQLQYWPPYEPVLDPLAFWRSGTL
ncbi:MAG: hypothetical protein WCA35_09630 [Kovacikia sp.]